jgi:glycerophosphoryl diester phosphodiesterase
MNKLFLVLTIVSIAMTGCGSSSNGTGGMGGTEPKCQTPQEMIRCDKVVNIAHRGGRRVRPEHTLLAYDQALVDGADILELDVHETIDGEIVVMHDGTVDRTTDCSGAIKEMTFAEIRECDAGYNFSSDDGVTYPYRDMGLVVPTMQEVFDRYPDTAFVIEIKQASPSIVDHFVEVVRASEVEDKMIGAAFSDSVMDELRAAAPEIATSMGVDDTLVFWANSFGELDPEYEPPAEFLQVPTEFEGIKVLHPGFVPRAHELGMFVHIWTINDEEEMRFLIETYGVDGIMTDYPPRLTKVINELGVGD